jgi:hypothetical protein
MRSVLALCILIALAASASAAPKRPQAQSRPVIAGPGQAAAQGYVTPRGARVYRDDSVPGGWRTDHDEPPSPNDPSRRGGG